MNDLEWEREVARLWAEADRSQPEALVSGMKRVCEGHEDAPALYELASAHDFAGREAEAVSLYERALERGLAGPRRDEAVIQLASSLRNVGQPERGVEILETMSVRDELQPAALAFKVLCLHDAGRATEAVSAALLALTPSVSLYSGAVTRYAEELVRR